MGQARTGLRVLVTGGAGYIGSHVLCHLAAAGHEAVAYDNLSTGHRWAVLDTPLVIGDLGDRKQLESVLSGRPFDAVIHCAGSIWVSESMRQPAKYYYNNTSNAIRLFDLCAQYGIAQIVLSSTAAVYGAPDRTPIDEATPLAPINPYGASKMMAERALADIAAASGMRHATLRYFNVAGADADARIGEATPDNNHLVKAACETALGLRDGLTINGTDYPTPDGTCVRDYVHVDDLARAHVDALTYLGDGGASLTVNCGYAEGYSVRQVLETVRRITAAALPVGEGPRRPGDPPVLIADNRLIRERLGWQPRHADLDQIVASAWRWEQRLQQMRRSLARAA